MLMSEGQIYRCQNRTCGCEVVVTKTSAEGDLNPHCCCGSEMKKPYMRPVFRKLPSQPLLAEQFSRAVSER
jgi:hypothetical protein